MADRRAAAAVTVGALIHELTGVLAAASIPEPKHEARDIVAAVLDMPRLWPSINRGEELDAESVAAARAAARKR